MRAFPKYSMLLLQTQKNRQNDETSPPYLVNLTLGRLPAKAPLRKEQPVPQGGKNTRPNKPGEAGELLNSNGLRLLPRVPRQAGRVTIHAQFLRTARAQLIFRQHAQDRFANHPLRLGLA